MSKATILNKQVNPIGYGLGSLTTPPKFPPEDQAIECLRTAAELGCYVWNAGEFYGLPSYNSLVLLNHFFAKYPEYSEKVILNVKGAMLPTFTPSGDPEFVRKSVNSCLSQLGRKIDMYETARIDLNIPLETQLTTLKELVDAGQIGGVALTEVNANTIREASKITKIAAVEIELSLWCTDPLHNGILQTCAELDIPVMAYCPVGRGFLTGTLLAHDDIPEGDYRRMLPRYQPQNLETNLKLVKEVERLAEDKRCTTTQVALGWLLALSQKEDMPTIIPIPGSASVEHIRENVSAIALEDDDMVVVDSILAKHPIAGERYHAHGMKYTNL